MRSKSGLPEARVQAVNELAKWFLAFTSADPTAHAFNGGPSNKL
jgi:hypothetical protein